MSCADSPTRCSPCSNAMPTGGSDAPTRSGRPWCSTPFLSAATRLSADRLTRDFILLRALRWLPVGLVLPFLIITPQARGLTLGEIGIVFAVHSGVAMLVEVPSGALADALGRRPILVAGAALTALSLVVFAFAQTVIAFVISVGLLAAGRALISGSLEAWYVDSLRLLDPLAPLAHGLSRGTAAEGVAMALGSLTGGLIVALSGPADGGSDTLSAYGGAALAGALAAVVYLIAIVILVHERPAAAAASAGRALRQSRSGGERDR